MSVHSVSTPRETIFDMFPIWIAVPVMIVILSVIFVLGLLFKIPLFFYNKTRDGVVIALHGPAVRREVLQLLERKIISHISCGLPRTYSDLTDPEGPIHYDQFVHLAGQSIWGTWTYNWEPWTGERQPDWFLTNRRLEGIRQYRHLLYWMLLPLVRAQRKTTPKFPVFAVNRCIYVNILPAALRLAA